MSSNHVPLPESVWKAVVGTAVMMASKADSQESVNLWLGVGLVWWLGFLMILRPREMMAAGRRTLCLALDFADTGGWISLCIEDPKPRSHFGFKEFAHVVEPKLEAWLSILCQSRRKEIDAMVFGGPRAKLLSILRSVFGILGLVD